MRHTKKVLVYLSAFLSFTAFAKTGNTQLPQQPLSFTENKGQIHDQHHNQRADIDYKLSAPGIDVFVGDGQLHYQWAKQDAANTTTYRMDVKLLGANRDAVVTAEQKVKDKETYYFPGIGKDGLTASLYNKITYKDVYPNIDWVLYSDGSGLKYDFVVHAGGNAKDIQLQFAGATALALNNGNLAATTPFGSITEKAPYSYNAETKEKVTSKFVLNGNVLSFDVATANKAIVIDPVVAWGTYFGGTTDENHGYICTDKNANVYLCGSTTSTTNVATTGAFQTTFSSNFDAYLVKFNANGQRQWATYYGGAGYEMFTGCSVDKYGNVYAVTPADQDMQSLITSGAHQTVFASIAQHPDLILAKFDASGARLWATYYGGTLDDQNGHVACDTSDNVYLYGMTYSNNNMVTPGTQKTTMGAPQLFLVKFNGAGTRQWGTYHGGTDGTETYDGKLIVDEVGNPIISGSTKSATSSAFTTPSCFQSAYGGGTRDGFIAKYNKTNGLFIWATYYGGPDDDALEGICADNNGNTYVVGYTINSGGFAGSSGTHQPLPAGSLDMVVAKFNNSGQRVWGTYYGGAGGDVGKTIGIRDGKITAWGACASGSATNIATLGSQYPTLGTNKSFFTILDVNGQRQYGSYFPNSGDVTIGAYGDTYFSGVTSVTTGIGTPGTHQPSLSGAKDAFIIKLGPDTAVNINQPYTDTLFCPSSTFNVNYTVTGGFNTGNVFTVQLSDASGSFASAIDIGTVAATASGSVPCAFGSSIPLGTGYRIRIVASNPVFTSMDNGVDIHINSTVTPTVGVTANPAAANAGPWKTITFTAAPAGGGTSPTYQWRKNGIDISGATADVYTAVLQQDLVTGDVITVKMMSNETCAAPDSAISAGITVNVNTSVSHVAGNKLNVYPNPTNGLLYITGSTAAMEITVVNMTGQVVSTQQLPAGLQQRTLDIDAAVANGVYILKLKTGDVTETLRLSVQR